ncbi:MAG: TIGR02449 family protein [Arenicella sp.]
MSITTLEEKVDWLINEIRRLKDENTALRGSQDSLLTERSNLQEKNKLARARLESIVKRLKIVDEQ